MIETTKVTFEFGELGVTSTGYITDVTVTSVPDEPINTTIVGQFGNGNFEGSFEIVFTGTPNPFFKFLECEEKVTNWRKRIEGKRR